MPVLGAGVAACWRLPASRAAQGPFASRSYLHANDQEDWGEYFKQAACVKVKHTDSRCQILTWPKGQRTFVLHWRQQAHLTLPCERTQGGRGSSANRPPPRHPPAHVSKVSRYCMLEMHGNEQG